MKLSARYVEKPWGRTVLPSMFDHQGGGRIGEVWFEGQSELPLLIKYIFTSERLSIQVHPDDEQARARGLVSGKSESWLIVDAEPGATLGLGLRQEVSKEELREAALDGSIEQLVDWRPVAQGDFFSVPAGTIHAIGGGISLIEIQQNSDVTYRLYDYGRPRELHLDDAVSVAVAGPYPDGLHQRAAASEDRVLLDGPHFIVARAHGDDLTGQTRWVIPLETEVSCGSASASPGECLLLAPGDLLETGGAAVILAASLQPNGI
jgi:mannose-6-phosphate isomerase